MTANDEKALCLLARLGTTRAGNFGEDMSTSECRKPPQAYARPGGNALARLVKLGYAETYVDRGGYGNWGWCITGPGRRAAAKITADGDRS